jgi:hypothetical protein
MPLKKGGAHTQQTLHFGCLNIRMGQSVLQWSLSVGSPLHNEKTIRIGIKSFGQLVQKLIGGFQILVFRTLV